MITDKEIHLNIEKQNIKIDEITKRVRDLREKVDKGELDLSKYENSF